MGVYGELMDFAKIAAGNGLPRGRIEMKNHRSSERAFRETFRNANTP